MIFCCLCGVVTRCVGGRRFCGHGCSSGWRRILNFGLPFNVYVGDK